MEGTGVPSCSLGNSTRSYGRIDVKDFVQAENSARATIAQILGGVTLLIGLYFTGRNLKTAQEGQITDRFTKAIAQLGDTKIEVRLGGIYALERIAKDSKKDYWSIMEILTAYVREHAKRSGKEKDHALVRVPTDIQAILTTLGRRQRIGEKDQYQRLDLRKVNLNGADLAEGHFERTLFTEASLERARLTSAYLKDTDLSGVNLEKASLVMAHLEGADLSGANLKEAVLAGAKVNDATFWGAHLEGAYLEDTKLTLDQIEDASIDDTTELPPALIKGKQGATQNDKARS